jgi:ABC-type microcin C transport system permease subunit YejB
MCYENRIYGLMWRKVYKNLFILIVVGLEGAILQSLSHGFVASALLCEIIYA